MRPTASVLHLDLDAFFASVEQRDKPSLADKPVIVGGLGGRGVVSTASYQARALGVHSAMSMTQARRLAPHAAYLSPRFDAYRQSSRIVMSLLGELSPLVEPLSIDEAFVDLAAGGNDTSPDHLEALVTELRDQITVRTEGLHASVGVGTSKFIAKLASEAAKPDGWLIVEPGTEVETIGPMKVSAIPGIGPATSDKLSRLGVHTVAELREVSEHELVRELGKVAGSWVYGIAFARDDRPVSPRGEAKSISVEDTFAEDIVDPAEVNAVIDRDAKTVAQRLSKAGLFAKTITLKIRHADFTTLSRSRTLMGATDDPDRIASVARQLAVGMDTRTGIRLVGVGVANFTQAAQEELFSVDDEALPQLDEIRHEHSAPPGLRHRDGGFIPGMDVEHDELGRGWVWGSGHGIVTVRFESRGTPIGPVRSFKTDDPALHQAEIMPMEHAVPETDDDEHGPGWARNMNLDTDHSSGTM